MDLEQVGEGKKETRKMMEETNKMKRVTKGVLVMATLCALSASAMAQNNTSGRQSPSSLRGGQVITPGDRSGSGQGTGQTGPTIAFDPTSGWTTQRSGPGWSKNQPVYWRARLRAWFEQ